MNSANSATAASKVSTRKSRRRAPIDKAGYLFIAPGYLVYFAFIFIPLLVGLYYSFTNYNFYSTPAFIGFDNYVRLFHDKLFGTAVYNTFIYSLFSIFPQMALGLLLAVLLNGKLRGRLFARVSVYIPNVTSMVAVSMIWLWIYDPSLGILNRVLKTVGLAPVQWLYDPSTAMAAIIMMGIWKSIGYTMIVYLSGLQSIPTSLYEAAHMDGATKVRQFFAITIPMLKPTTFFILVMSCINSFMVFEQVNILTNGGPLNKTTTIVHQIYLRGFQDFQMGYASAMAMVLFVITLLITLLNFRLGNKGNDTDVD
ncbi:multiple sugar transport system permease protein/raffinose/stachyose/melibiose transport system permease protein [Paenibacillus sp. BK033]|uniref:carbohydrate ABC transporter permease n=1 Tax=Paenibacillus sp. BK033 TaxID=2512133 RepID=UPI00104B2CB3|nr:sugar ABC transporter permease [Paenibacillus sp. BK033]TCM95899.1 multiple sugar transport system permease protein/raffinose/stachyose/melibiose transport system permease protein [Paenibacillus sp. BK033]